MKRYSPWCASAWLCLVSLPLAAQPIAPTSPARQPSKRLPPAVAPIAWSLSGQELLLDVEDRDDVRRSGIYRWLPSAERSRGTLRLLIPGGHAPVWSPRRKCFAYTQGGDICIADLQGHQARLTQMLPAALTLNREPPVRWEPNGNLYSVIHSQYWGTRVCRSGSYNESRPGEQIQYSRFWRGVFNEQIIPLQHPEANTSVDYFGTGEGGVPWSNVLNTGLATFSPDNRHLVAEVYPGGPEELQRHASRLRVFDFFEWSENEAESAKQALAPSQNLLPNGVLPAVTGTGRVLTTVSEDQNQSEIEPLWSPRGDWIAFNRVDFARYSVSPIVIKPDSTQSSEIVPPEVKTSDTVFGAGHSRAWGHPHVRAIAWSDDGKYLWLMGSQGSQIWAAMQQGGRWTTQLAVSPPSGTTLGITQSAFHGSAVAWLHDDLLRHETVQTRDVETRQGFVLDLPAGMHVVQLAW